MWLAIAVVLPLGYLLALISRPDPIENSSDLIDQAKTTIIKELADHPVLKAWLSKNASDTYFLELDLRKPSNHPLAGFYLGDSAEAAISNCQLLGTVGAAGHQRFVVDSLLLGKTRQYLLQYDPIRKEKIYSIALQMH